MAFDPNRPAASGMVLTFDDEFTSANGQFAADNVASNTKWSTHVWWMPAPAQFNGSVHDGVLDMAPGTEINTINSAGDGWGQKFGYFEARIKLAPDSNVMEGLFLLSQDHAKSGPAPASELDVIESPPGDPTNILTTLHRDSAHPGDRQNEATGGNPYVNVGVDTTAGYHTYGALWDPNSSQITWYFDGRQVMTQPKYDTTDGSAMFLDLINTTGTGHMYVDYVRAWQFPGQGGTAAAPDPVSAPFGQLASNGSSLPGTTPSPSPSPGPVPAASADGTIVHGTSGQIVTGAHNVFAINAGGQITLNGTVMGETHQVSELAYLNHTLYQEATAQNRWWSYNESTNTWTETANPLPSPAPAPAPTPTPAPASADGTIVLGTSGSIVTDAHNVFAIDAGGQITLNGTVMGETHQVTELAYLNHTLYQEATAQNRWWSYNEASHTWTETTKPLSNPTPTPTPTPAPSAGDPPITLHVSGDHWQGKAGGDPQFVVLVDGQQVGGVQTVTAVHDSGQWQDITVSGTFADPKEIDVKFINDQYGGTHATDVNLYVGAITVGGHTYLGSAATNDASQGYTDTGTPNAAVMVQNGTLAFHPVSTPTPAPAPAPTPAPVFLSPSFSDGAGHDVFLFSTLAPTGQAIASFDAHDILDLAPALKAAGYQGSDPLADHVVALVPTGTDATAVKVDPTGQDAGHAATLVTLNHVVPQDIHAANFWA